VEGRIKTVKQDLKLLNSVRILVNSDLDPDLDPEPVFYDQKQIDFKIEKKIQLFWSKMAICLFLDVHTGLPIYR
jgi:hypothetical protein